MAKWILPVQFHSPDFQFSIDLDGFAYGMRFIYNARSSRWSMEIQDVQGAPIVSGITLTTNALILDRFKDSRLPPGNLFIMDTTGTNQEPDALNFGDSVLLCYEDADLINPITGLPMTQSELTFGSMALQNAYAVNISGGSIDGLIISGGTY